ncbi:uncharacterized protein [Rutidosis leptorrhynchoides]|uniref:uncharacterized protein n=1 Tax=Rutidosis leptorrhynchoides TaxID=125765 RepID=UPI003A9A4339
MLQVAGGLDIEQLRIEILRRLAYCLKVEEEPDGQPWYHDILKYLQKGEFLEGSEAADRKHLIKLASKFFTSGDVLYKRSFDLTLLRGVDAKEANHLMKEIHEGEFQIKHLNSSSYHPKMNGAVEAANKNIKKILSKTAKNYCDWHDRLPYALMAYRTFIRTFIGAPPFSLVYGMEAVLLVEVEVPSLRVLSQSKLDETEWMQQRHK